MPNGSDAEGVLRHGRSRKPAANGLRTVLNFQRVASQRYFDAAGFPGRTVGLDAEAGETENGGEITRRSGRLQENPLDAIRIGTGSREENATKRR